MYELQYPEESQIGHSCCPRDELLKMLLYLAHMFSDRSTVCSRLVLPTARTLVGGTLA